MRQGWITEKEKGDITPCIPTRQRGEQGDKGQIPTIFEELDLCWRKSAFLGLGCPTCNHVGVCKFMLIKLGEEVLETRTQKESS